MGSMVAPAPLPEQIEKLIQLAETKPTAASAAAGHPSVLEPKYDGWRTVWKVDESGKARFFTRSGQELTGAWPAAEAEIARALKPGSVIDGEAVGFVTTPAGVSVPKWGVAQSVLGSGTAKAALRSGALTLVVFDLIASAGIDARPLPFEKRREVMEKLFAEADFAPCVRLAPQLDPTDLNYEALVGAGYEGAVVKWLDAPYRSGGRGQGWWRLKATATVDVVVTGYKPGENGFAGLVGAIEFGQHDENGVLIPRGRCSGMDFATRVAVTKNQDAYLGKVFEMRHMGLMDPGKDYPLGAFRHPQWKRWRQDRSPESVVVHDG